jgi:hypothetical protein
LPARWVCGGWPSAFKIGVDRRQSVCGALRVAQQLQVALPASERSHGYDVESRFKPRVSNMAIKIKLSSGEEIVIRGAQLNDVREAFSRALTENEVFSIRNSSGRVLALNPREILSLEEVPDPAVAAA